MAPLVPDAENAVLAQPLVPFLIELPQADDVGGEAWDVVYPVKRLMFPPLHLKRTVLGPFMSTMEPSLNLMVPWTLVSSLKKAYCTLVMWFVAPVSMIHHADSPSLLSLS